MEESSTQQVTPYVFNKNKYAKEKEYMTALIKVFSNMRKVANNQKNEQNKRRLNMILVVFWNYLLELSKEFKLDVKAMVLENKEEGTGTGAGAGASRAPILLAPIIEYVVANEIEYIDFTPKSRATEELALIDSIDMTLPQNIERFVLSHVYYFTQL